MNIIQYKDVSGNPCSLDWLVKNEPEWAANQIRHRDELQAEIERLKDERNKAAMKERAKYLPQLTALQSKYDAALADWHRSDTKLSAAVEALERISSDAIEYEQTRKRIAREALAKIKE